MYRKFLAAMAVSLAVLFTIGSIKDASTATDEWFAAAGFWGLAYLLNRSR